MPVFVLNTNIPVDKIPKSFLTDTSKLIAKELGKPETVSVACRQESRFPTKGECVVCKTANVQTKK